MATKHKKRHSNSTMAAKKRANAEAIADQKDRARRRMNPVARNLLLGDVVFMACNGFAGEVLAALCLLAASGCAFVGFDRVRRIHNAMTVIPGKAAQNKAGEQA